MQSSKSAAVTQISIPGFSPEQISALSKLISDAVDQAFDRHFGPLQPIQQPIQQPKDHMQEVEHLDIQSSGEAAVKCTRFGAAFPAGKHVFLQSLDVATSPQHAAGIPWVGIALFDGMFLVQNGAICMPRMGVG